MDPELEAKLPSESKKIYQGEGWRYFKVPIPAGDFNITGKVLADVCQKYEMKTPCAVRLRYYQQDLCIETAHTTSGLTSNIIELQLAITEKGYDDGDADHLEYTFCYSLPGDDDEIDGACGYWPGYYCHQGKTTISDGVNKFALCVLSN